ncbi:MAG: NAD(P)-dependent oxidoreductase [SAR202 cluster bacterium]|jgi:hypothetical protein|nr:NAD(P)-dependent oxidoreductase [SAR202 cluster bacterium]|tara:strand:+ start:930 stop:1835 length:906 start_codon:yes stop_codon:yes gene_type:complete
MTKKKRLLMTGAAGYVADQMLSRFREKYELVLLDTSTKNRRGEEVEGVTMIDLIDEDRTRYAHFFEEVDAVIHLAYKRRTGQPLDHFYDERENVQMAYNVLRSSYDSGVKRVAIASSNHASDFYEHALIHERKLEMLDPYRLALSDNFYGWAKATYEHLGFLFACGAMGDEGSGLSENLVAGNLNTSRKMGVVMVRIGAPRNLDPQEYEGNSVGFKRDLGAYISPRDITQLFEKCIEVENIENEYGVPWQVVYGISNNTRAFWSLSNARKVFGYEPKDDSDILFAEASKSIISEAGRVGPV